jgi:hypothetical protein
MKTEVEIREELARIRILFQQARDQGDDTNILYGAQQALGWTLDELQSPTELEATIRELQEATEALQQIKAIAERALKERAYGSPEEAKKIARVLEIATKALDDHDQAVPNLGG